MAQASAQFAKQLVASSIPCGNLIERDGGSCMLPDYKFPDDCVECIAHVPGLTEQEKLRHEQWQRVTFVKRKIQFCEGAGHD
jgi:hypothetical protein